jgi:hypothetical protein
MRTGEGVGKREFPVEESSESPSVENRGFSKSEASEIPSLAHSLNTSYDNQEVSITTNVVDKFQCMFSNIDKLTLAVTILLAIIGWLVALWLQRSNARHEHKIQVWYDIYKQLLKCSQETQGKLAELGAMSSPLILMETTMIPFNLKLKKEYKDECIPYNEQECLHDGEKKWLDFIRDAYDKYFSFVGNNNEMLIAFEGWEAALKPLMHAKKVFSNESSTLSRKIHRDIGKLQMYNIEHGHDWRKWKKDEIDLIVNQIRENSFIISCYISDLMTLVHNELLANHFKYKKSVRETLDPKYKVLTQEGLILRLEDNHEQKLKEILEDGEGGFIVESEESRGSILYNLLNTDLMKETDNCVKIFLSALFLLVPPTLAAFWYVKQISVDITIPLQLQDRTHITTVKELPTSLPDQGIISISPSTENVFLNIPQMTTYLSLFNINPTVIKYELYLSNKVQAKMYYFDPETQQHNDSVMPAILICGNQRIPYGQIIPTKVDLQLDTQDGKDAVLIKQIYNDCTTKISAAFKNNTGKSINIEKLDFDKDSSFDFAVKPGTFSITIIYVSFVILWLIFLKLVIEGIRTVNTFINVLFSNVLKH